MNTIDSIVAANEELTLAIENFNACAKPMSFGRISFALEEAQGDAKEDAKKTLWERFKAFLARIVSFFTSMRKKRKEAGTDSDSVSNKAEEVFKENARKTEEAVKTAQEAKKADEAKPAKPAQQAQEPQKPSEAQKADTAKSTEKIIGDLIRGTLNKKMVEFLEGQGKDSIYNKYTNEIVKRVRSNAACTRLFVAVRSQGTNGGLNNADKQLDLLESYLNALRTAERRNDTFVSLDKLTKPDLAQYDEVDRYTDSDFNMAIHSVSFHIREFMNTRQSKAYSNCVDEIDAILKKMADAPDTDNGDEIEGQAKNIPKLVTEYIVPIRNFMDRLYADCSAALDMFAALDDTILESTKSGKLPSSFDAQVVEEIKAEFTEKHKAFMWEESYARRAISDYMVKHLHDFKFIR